MPPFPRGRHKLDPNFVRPVTLGSEAWFDCSSLIAQDPDQEAAPVD